MSDHNAVQLDPREGHYWIPSHHDGLSLFLRHLGPEDGGYIQAVDFMRKVTNRVTRASE